MDNPETHVALNTQDTGQRHGHVALNTQDTGQRDTCST